MGSGNIIKKKEGGKVTKIDKNTKCVRCLTHKPVFQVTNGNEVDLLCELCFTPDLMDMIKENDRLLIIKAGKEDEIHIIKLDK